MKSFNRIILTIAASGVFIPSAFADSGENGSDHGKLLPLGKDIAPEYNFKIDDKLSDAETYWKKYGKVEEERSKALSTAIINISKVRNLDKLKNAKSISEDENKLENARIDKFLEDSLVSKIATKTGDTKAQEDIIKREAIVQNNIGTKSNLDVDKLEKRQNIFFDKMSSYLNDKLNSISPKNDPLGGVSQMAKAPIAAPISPEATTPTSDDAKHEKEPTQQPFVFNANDTVIDARIKNIRQKYTSVVFSFLVPSADDNDPEPMFVERKIDPSTKKIIVYPDLIHEYVIKIIKYSPRKIEYKVNKKRYIVEI
ncbi:hypothetical protein [Photobacterium kishitanii]|uniref:Uncharacterized protein n=1 Tax=Photobacterium kishitanii TaxID=318456 RepID=A0A2T3KN08_9GAMM|nr:hypothetical protein [Photobacterium kishitanii]PSV01189.1 hypothetical protein C9J27_03965 [Photobacterium kishitanii]